MRLFKTYKNKILPFLSKKVTQMPTLEQTQDELIQLLYGQVVDLSMMSKIELGDDVLDELNKLNREIL
jgi:hypothetical protein